MELSKLPETSKIREHIVNDVSGNDYFRHGETAANIALCFGSGASVAYVAGQIASIKPRTWAGLDVWQGIESGAEDSCLEYFTSPEYTQK